MWGDTLHASTVNPQFLAEHGNFGFQLVDCGVLHVTIVDQCYAANEHRDSYDADDAEYGVSDGRSPIFGMSTDDCHDLHPIVVEIDLLQHKLTTRVRAVAPLCISAVPADLQATSIA